MVLLVHPPVSKPSEPPPGIATLAGALKGQGGHPCDVLDANLGGILHLFETPGRVSDTWTQRARRRLPSHLQALRDPGITGRFGRYQHAVHDLNRVLRVSDPAGLAEISLNNFNHRELSPVKSADLLLAAERPQSHVFYPYFEKALGGAIERGRPSLVGFSLNYLSQALCTFAMAGFVKKRYPGVKIVLGGGLVTSWMRRSAGGDPFAGLIDYAIAGPGEGPLRSLLGLSASFERDGGAFLPDYERFPLDEYLSPGRILPYSASSGCYWNRCLFCPERAEGNPYVPVAPREAAARLGSLVRRLKPSLVHLLDNALSPAFMKALTDDPPGAPWYGFARVTHHLAEEDFCWALRKAGCAMLKLGLESGDQGVLDALQKGIDVRLAAQALATLRKAGIATYVYLLFGTPPETPEGAGKTLRFVVEAGEGITFLNLAIFNMPVRGPGTESFETSFFYDGDLSLYTDFAHPHGWGRRDLRDFLDREFRRHPAVAPILRRDPRFFTSNHAAFFTPASRA